jgi:hypothetical protein
MIFIPHLIIFSILSTLPIAIYLHSKKKYGKVTKGWVAISSFLILYLFNQLVDSLHPSYRDIIFTIGKFFVVWAGIFLLYIISSSLSEKK